MTTETKTKTTAKKQVKSPLRNERILIKPVIWANKLINSKHSGNWQYDNTSLLVTVRIDPISGMLIDPLTKEEREFFENPELSGMSFKPGDLSARNKNDNYWENYEYRLHKESTGAIKEDDILAELDLSKPEDYFRYKVLLTNSGQKGFVSEGWRNRYNRGTNRIVLVNEGEKYYDSLNKANKLKIANKFFYDIDHSVEKMTNFLNVFYLENKDYRKPPTDAGNDWYKSEIQNLIDKRVDDVIRVVQGDDYELKTMVNKALKNGVLRFNGRTGIDIEATGKPIGNTLSEAIRYFKDDKNQNDLLKIKGVLEKDKDE